MYCTWLTTCKSRCWIWPLSTLEHANFIGNETGKLYSKFPTTFLMQFLSNRGLLHGKPSAVNCTAWSQKKGMYILNFASPCLLETADKTKLCGLDDAPYHTHANMVCDSCHAVLAISRQELQIVFHNLFSSCQACVKVEGSHLQELG